MDLICDFSENMLKKVQMFVSTVSYQSVLDLPLKTVAFPLSPLLFKSVFLHLECWENSGNIRKLTLIKLKHPISVSSSLNRFFPVCLYTGELQVGSNKD